MKFTNTISGGLLHASIQVAFAPAAQARPWAYAMVGTAANAGTFGAAGTEPTTPNGLDARSGRNGEYPV